MQASHRQGLASHPDPRSCGGCREGPIEAWTGASAGGAIARRNAAIGVPTPLDFGGRPHGEGRQREPSADPASSKTPGTSRNFLHEKRATSAMSESTTTTDRGAKAPCRTASMPVSEASDHAVVPMNPSNKDGHPSAERGEGRAWTKEHARPSPTSPTQRGARVCQGLARVRQAARKHQQEQFTALRHHLTVDRLRDSFHGLQRHAAPGVDRVTWQAYAIGLEERLADLHRRVHRGTYRAHPSRRVNIPKPDGRQRPWGVAAREDKIVQQAVVTILTQIDAEDLRGVSYGYRPGRRPHHALDALSVALTRTRVNDVGDGDMRGFFDTLSHAGLVKFLPHRVADPRILRCIQTWRRAGVSEAVLGFEHRREAERFWAALRDRLHPCGLELQAEKTRLMACGPHAIANRKPRGEGKPETFDFLGCTHSCERHRKTGDGTVRRQTARKRLVAKLKAIQPPLRPRRHEPMAPTGQWRTSVVQGYFHDHAVPGNMRTLGTFRRRVSRRWRRPLGRRRPKARLPWPRLKPLIRRWIPTPRILHPFPRVRFDARHPR
jgi:RNA-directed DNA polymerase